MWIVTIDDQIDSIYETERSAEARVSELRRSGVEDVFVYFDEGTTT